MLVEAVILILKHATFLRLSNMSGASALAHAEVDYREGNIDSKIRQHLTAPSQEHSDESSAGFIMAIDLSFAAEIAQSDEVRIAQLHGSDPKKVARLDHIFEQPFHMGPAGDALVPTASSASHSRAQGTAS
ncbi:hypothetical protein EDB85DRAFT_2293399 [Lactarius pseudohatsudake]|nr:hypothetical protein EDB85DRAFT_2293399 [Lactarius pseudohatsudake]